MNTVIKKEVMSMSLTELNALTSFINEVKVLNAKSTLEVGMKVNIVQKTKKTPGTITKVNQTIKYEAINKRFDPSSYNNGFIAVKYKNELYNLETGKRASRQWGIIADEVMSQVKIIVVPPEYDPKTNYGVFPNEGRDTLMMEDGNKDQETKVLDLKEVREFFIDNMPQEVSDLIDNALKKKMNFKHSDEEIFNKYKFLFKLKVTREVEDQLAYDKDGQDQLQLPIKAEKGDSTGSDPKTPKISKKMKEKLSLKSLV